MYIPEPVHESPYPLGSEKHPRRRLGGMVLVGMDCPSAETSTKAAIMAIKVAAAIVVAAMEERRGAFILPGVCGVGGVLF